MNSSLRRIRYDQFFHNSVTQPRVFSTLLKSPGSPLGRKHPRVPEGFATFPGVLKKSSKKKGKWGALGCLAEIPGIPGINDSKIIQNYGFWRKMVCGNAWLHCRPRPADPGWTLWRRRCCSERLQSYAPSLLSCTKKPNKIPIFKGKNGSYFNRSIAWQGGQDSIHI